MAIALVYLQTYAKLFGQGRQRHSISAVVQGEVDTSGYSRDPWDNLRQTASDIAQSVSDGFAALTNSVNYWLQEEEQETDTVDEYATLLKALSCITWSVYR